MKRLLLASIALLFTGAVIAAEINSLDVVDGNNTARFAENQTPSSLNDGARALEGMIARWYVNTAGSTDSAGTADAYTMDAQGTFTLFDGQAVAFTVTLDNTGTSTLNVDSTGAKTIMKHFNQPLEAGDLKSGQIAEVVYDGTNWQLVSPLAQKEAPTLANDAVTADVIKDNAVTLAKLFAGDQGDLITFDSGNTAVTVDAGTSGYVLTSNGTSSQPTFQAGGGLAGFAQTSDAAAATGTTTLPGGDDTIPQITEGNQYLSLTYDATSTSNTLLITVVAHLASDTIGYMTGALFHGATADAIASGLIRIDEADIPKQLVIEHAVTPDSANPTGYYFRAGLQNANTTTFNGFGGARKQGGVLSSTMTIQEIAP